MLDNITQLKSLQKLFLEFVREEFDDDGSVQFKRFSTLYEYQPWWWIFDYIRELPSYVSNNLTTEEGQSICEKWLGVLWLYLSKEEFLPKKDCIANDCYIITRAPADMDGIRQYFFHGEKKYSFKNKILNDKWLSFLDSPKPIHLELYSNIIKEYEKTKSNKEYRNWIIFVSMLITFSTIIVTIPHWIKFFT